MADEFAGILHEIDFALEERAALRTSGPNFTIVHRFRAAGSDCAAGEEIALISLVHRSQNIPLRLSLALRIFFDHLARHRLPQSAAQIEASIRNDPFYIYHGANAKTRRRQSRSISRSSVKTYVARLRDALSRAFREAGIAVDPSTILVSEETEGNSVRYRLRGNFRWVHVQ
jgi:hypothetical protein